MEGCEGNPGRLRDEGQVSWRQGVQSSISSHASDWICIVTGHTLTELHEYVRDFEFRFVGKLFVLSLLVLGFEGFDVILGMNWLGEHLALLDCGRRRLTITMPEGNTLVHQCETPRDSVMTSFLYSLE